LAIVLEDIHWADDRMLTLIEMLAARSQGQILIVATARPEFLEAHPGFGTGQDISVVSLRPLTGVQSERLIDELIGSAGLPSGIVDEMRAKADGNPFFLEEMLQRFVDEGALVSENGAWHATERAATVKLSDNVHSLLAARIDALPVAEKQFLQEASVVGRIFWPGALSRETALSPAAAGEVLHSLERRGLIAVRPTSTIGDEPEYMFRHMLIHDVAYGSVPKARRARAHADVGRWLESLAVDRQDEYEELIAYHYSAAITAEDADLAWSDRRDEHEQVRRRAFEMLVRAGASARHRFATDKALQLHGEALAIAKGTAELALIHEELGDDHEALYRGDDTVAAYLAAIEEARQLSDADERIPSLVAKAARMAIRWGAFRDAPPVDELQALIAECLARPVSDDVRAPLLIASAGLARGRNNIPIGAGRTLLSKDELPDLDERIADVEEGMRIAEQIGDPSLQYMAFALLSILYQASEQEQRYREKCEEALSLINKLPSRREQVDLLVSVAGARADAGRYEDSLLAGEDAFARSTDLSPHERMHAAWEIYRAAEPLGRWDRMLEILPWYAEAAANEGEVTCAAVRAGPALGATVLARRGDSDRATLLVPVAVDTARTSTFGGSAVSALYASSLGVAEANPIVDDALSRPSSGFIGTGIAPLLDTLVALERYDDLEQFLPFAEGQAFANELAAPSIARAKAVLALRRGERESATDMVRTALARFTELSAAFQVARTSELLAELVDEPERTRLLRAALDAYEDLGANPFADRIRATVRAKVELSS
jgi:tetratricopeptide (TPR) repeat protein